MGYLFIAYTFNVIFRCCFFDIPVVRLILMICSKMILMFGFVM